MTILIRPSIDGTWRVDSTRGDSMGGFLRVMDCSDMAIEAMFKAEIEMPTVHRYTISTSHYTVTKRSRLNNFTESFPIGKRTINNININKDDVKEKATIVSVCTPKFVHIVSKLSTSNGVAEVVDKKQLSEDGTHLLQELQIRNLKTNAVNTTTRYWVPHEEEMDPFEIGMEGGGEIYGGGQGMIVGGEGVGVGGGQEYE